jgi:hypothetical protein
MPMENPKNRGGGDPANKYCVHCCDESGNLKNREQIREGMIQFKMQTTGKPREKAEKEVDEFMGTMTAWKER